MINNVILFYCIHDKKNKFVKNKLSKYKLSSIKIRLRCAISRLFIKSQSKQLHFIPTATANARSTRRKCGHWQNNTKTWWQSNTRRTCALAQSSFLLTARCRLFRCAIIVYSVRYRTFPVTGHTHDSHWYLRWMILTKQYYTHKTLLLSLSHDDSF